MSDKYFTFRNLNEIHIEITSACNLNCKYCYAEPYSPNSNKSAFVSSEMFQQITNVISEASEKKYIEIIFHGGEPLLQKPEWYDENCNYAVSKLKEKGKICSFGLQSNNTLLNEDFIKVFSKHNVMIGVSLDGDEEIHNLYRNSYKKTAQNIKELKKNNIFSGVIAVLFHHNYDKLDTIYSAFKEIGLRYFSSLFGSAVGNALTSKPLTGEQIFQSLKSNYLNLIKHNGEIIEVRLWERIRKHIEAIEGKDVLSQLRCDNPFCHAGSNMIYIKTNGNIYPCGSAGSNGEIANFKIGNINNPLEKNEYYEILKRFHAKDKKYIYDCQTCSAKYFCEHGCPAFDFSDPETKESKCYANKKFITFLKKRPQSEINRILSYTIKPEQ